MPKIPNKSFMESFMSFLKKPETKKVEISLIGKIVGVDTNHKSSDNYNLIHIYRIVDKHGKVGAFLGNIKYKSKMAHFRKNLGDQFKENIENWRELTPKEVQLVGKV